MSEISVAHLHTVDQAGGGAKIVRKLHKGLNNSNSFDSYLFVGKKKTNIDDIIELPSFRGEQKLNGLVEYILSLDGLASPSSFKHPNIIQGKDPDIIHIHNIHGGYFNFLNLYQVPEQTPVLWSFHDMWPLTGRCSYSLDCDKYRETCSDCPYLDLHRSIAFDSTKYLHKLKKRVFNTIDPHIIAPSQWMMKKISDSFFDITMANHIPHGIDTEQFSPVSNIRAKTEFDIPLDSTVLLFISNGFTNPVKGMDHLIGALKNINKKDVVLLAIGGEEIPTEIPERFDVRAPGYIDNSMVPVAYSAADLTIIPSLYESFGLVATESMACGTPVVAYDTSGLKEQITDSTGWLAEFKNVESLAEKINNGIKNEEQRLIKGECARRRILNRYDQQRFIEDHKEIYNSVDIKGGN